MDKKMKIIVYTGIALCLCLTIYTAYAVTNYLQKENGDSIDMKQYFSSKDFEILDMQEQQSLACPETLEGIYEDGENKYYLSCIKSDNVFIKYSDGTMFNIKQALNEGYVTPECIIAKGYRLYKEKKKYNGYEKVSTVFSSNADTASMVKFDGVLYGRSYAMIDYIGGGESIGIIDKLIDSQYVPKLDNETNNEDLLGALVFDKTNSNIVLLCKNTYVLFQKIV